MNPLLLNRPQSGFPVSISTGLALETILKPIQPVYDDAREISPLPDPTTYTTYLFNVSTLLRNLINSVSYKDLVTISKADVYEMLLEEITFLTEFFASNRLPIQFYVNTYRFVKATYTEKGCLRTATTDQQLYLDNLQQFCLDKLLKMDEVLVFHKDVKTAPDDRALIFTHVPFDLLSHGNFVRLDLLESHTGKIKTRKDWWSKYHALPNKDLSMFPMIEYLLAEVFGDNVMFKPAPTAKRVGVYEALVKKGIHPLMSEFSLLTLAKAG